MTAEIVDRVLASSRYRDVDRRVVSRLADEELPRSRNSDDAVKRVKRRLHQVVGAFRGAAAPTALADSWTGDLSDADFMTRCAEVLGGHASTRERIAQLDTFYPVIWGHTGVPRSVLDIGCGIGPLALPWMGLAPDAKYLATDVDRRVLETVNGFFALVGQPHETSISDATAEVPRQEADVALMLKLVPTLDRQDRAAALRLLNGLRVQHAVVSFPNRSLAGRAKGMERTYQGRIEELVAAAPRVVEVAEASVADELVFVLSLRG